MPMLPADLAADADAAGLQITGVLHQTDKTLLAAGTLAERRVAVKCLLDPDPFWAGKWRHELHVYQTFANNPPPVRIPRLLYTDNARLLVLEWLDGHRLDNDRYPQRSCTPAETQAVLDCVTTFNQWAPPPGAFEIVFDYPDRFRRYHEKGYLSDSDHAAVTRLLDRAGGPSQLNHGDPLPSNILMSEAAATLLDWEFTGLFLPGFDLAMLHTQLGAHTPEVKKTIDAYVAETDMQIAFLVNLTAVLTRELRLHRQLPEGDLRDSRLPLVEGAWSDARERLHQRARIRTRR